MQNINLNPGGLLGALLLGGVAAFVVFSFEVLGPRAVVVGVVAGAFAGNFSWGLLFPPAKENKTDRAHDDDEDERPRGKMKPRSHDEDDVEDAPRRSPRNRRADAEE